MLKNVVQIIFVSKSKVLLGFRQNTEALDQLWGFPSGRIEEGELPLQAAKREALEELAVDVNDLMFLCERPDPKLDLVHYFYICESWSGELINAEPHLCREICWFDIESLPKGCTPITYLILPKVKKYINRN
ncbi:NUDIX domain-containing protein [Psychromonas sp. PT13]|uniref:NUDIX domain-containing protein n=1 Tax=Psychromonas sp. PT13 TaxID=3439547 RepID=UPI003EBDA25F